jgi:hypothetical protein
MMSHRIVGPVEVTASFLCYPLVLPDGRKLHTVETADAWFAANERPLIRGGDGLPMSLHEEPSAGSRVLLALDDQNELRAVKLIGPLWDDPFSS